MRIVIGEDSAVVREGLALLLVQAGHDVVARAADAPAVVAAVLEHDPDLLVTECVRPGSPALVAQVQTGDLPRIARSADAAGLLARAGVHSYLVVPLIAILYEATGGFSALFLTMAGAAAIVAVAAVLLPRARPSTAAQPAAAS